MHPENDPSDTGDILAEAAEAGVEDPPPEEVTDTDDINWVEPHQGATPVQGG